MIIAVFGYLSFSTAELGWFDGRKVVRVTFNARTSSGELVAVPPAVFGLYSYQIGHGLLHVPKGHFRVGGDDVNWEDADRCGPLIVERDQFYVQSFRDIERLVRDADRHLRDYPAIKRFGLFYAYPHHFPTNPTEFAAFNRLDMHDVES